MLTTWPIKSARVSFFPFNKIQPAIASKALIKITPPINSGITTDSNAIIFYLRFNTYLAISYIWIISTKAFLGSADGEEPRPKANRIYNSQMENDVWDGEIICI